MLNWRRMEQTRRAEVVSQDLAQDHPLLVALRALPTTTEGASTEDGAAPTLTTAEVDHLGALLEEAVAPGENGAVARALSDAVASGRLRGLVSSRGVACHGAAVSALLRMGYPWAFHVSAEDFEEAREVARAGNAARGDGLSVVAAVVSLGALALADQTMGLTHMGPAGVLAHLSGMAMAALVGVGTSDVARNARAGQDEAIAASGALSAGLLYASTGSIVATAGMLAGTALALLARRVASKR